MRKQKALSVLLLSGIVMLFSSVLFQLFIVDFNRFDYIPFEVNGVGCYEERFTDGIEPMFRECGLEYFIVSVSSNVKSTEYSIYCSSEVRNKLSRMGYLEGEYRSITGNDIGIHYASVSSYTKRTSVSETENIYFLNSGNAERNSYLEENLIRGENSRLESVKLAYAGIWALWCILLLIISGIHVVFQKKQWLLEVCYGRPVKQVFLRELGLEIAAAIGSLTVFFICLRSFFNLRFMIWTWALAIPAYCILVSGIYVRAFFFMDYKAALQKTLFSSKLVFSCRLFKYALLAISVSLISISLFSTKTLFCLLQQKSFYQLFSDYSAISVAFDYENDSMLETCFTYDDEVYAEKLTDWNLIYWIEKKITEPGYEAECIQANKNAEFLLNRMGLETADCGSERLVLFLPETMSGLSEEEQKDLLFSEVNYPEDTPCETVFYETGISSYAFCGPESEAVKVQNPVIIWSNFSCYTPEIVDAPGWLCDWTGVAGTVSHEEITEYRLQNPNILYSTDENIYERYRKKLGDALLQALLFGGLGLITVILDGIVLGLLIRIEQEMKAMEIAVKKVYGSPFRDRYSEMVFTVFESAIFGLLAAVLIASKSETIDFRLTGTVTVCFVLLETMLLLRECLKWEKTALIKILKGGAL